MCGFGVLVYMVHLGYKHQESMILAQRRKETIAKVDLDLGAIEPLKLAK